MKYKLLDGVNIVASTNSLFDFSVGYHDIKPFNFQNENLILLHKYPKNLSNYTEKIKIDICLWDYVSKEMSTIDSTFAWSWEQGSRLQWLNEHDVIYNILKDEEFKSCIYNIESKEKKILDFPIYSFSPSAKKFLYIDYSRLWFYWKSYGYYSKSDKKLKDIAEDGVFISDLNNNKELLLSIKDAMKLCGLEKIRSPIFLAHPTFNTDGDKCVSLLRFLNKSGNLISYLICTDLSSKKNKIISKERVSHFEWINSDKIVVWSRILNNKLQSMRNNDFLEKFIVLKLKKIINKLHPNIKKKLLNTHYHLIDVNNDNYKILDKENLTEDGHPQISSNGKYLITDTYPNKEGFQKLLLYSIKRDKTIELGFFKTSEYLKENKLKYDLHPRWSKSNKLISIDSSHDGSRQSYIINIENILKKFE